MTLDFPEEKPVDDPILVPPVGATIHQLEEVNRQLTATIMAIFKMLEEGLQRRDMSYTMLSLYREDCLRELDSKLAANIERAAGKTRDEQVRYLQNHPEAILFSGEFARKD